MKKQVKQDKQEKNIYKKKLQILRNISKFILLEYWKIKI